MQLEVGSCDGLSVVRSDFATKVKEWLRRKRKDFDRIGVSNPLVLAAYNAIANGSDDRRRALLFGRSHRNLEGCTARFGWKTWPVRDGRVKYDLPLRDEHAGFDWARALTALGHDIEVKQVYRYLINETPAGRFIDVGANYGQHSHYFMAAGWDVWSFEPNTRCRAYHEEVCALNGWTLDQWRDVALGDREGQVRLSFTKGQEFLGRIADELVRDTDTSIEVGMQPLCSFFETVENAVVKIDVEGHERYVIRGFPPGLERVRCLLFEALDIEELSAVQRILERAGLLAVGLAVGGTRPPLEALQSGLTNFAAAREGSPEHRWLLSRGLSG